MRIPFLVSVLVGATAASSLAQQAGDKTELEGVWQRIVGVRHGEKVEVARDTIVTIRGRNFELRAGNRRITVGTFTIDPKKTPREIDVTYTEGPDTGKVIRAIYQLDGDKLEFRTPGSVDDPRPTTFVTAEQSRGFFSSNVRVKDAKR